MASKRDYYDVLDISRNATEEEVRKAFRQKALQYHPDRNKDPGALDQFKEINEAYQVLTDPKRRQQYDQWGHAGMGGQAGQGFEGFSGFEGFGDIFEAFFGGAGFGGLDLCLSMTEPVVGMKFAQLDVLLLFAASVGRFAFGGGGCNLMSCLCLGLPCHGGPGGRNGSGS